MHSVQDDGERRRIVQELLKVLACLVVRKVQAELAEDLFVHVSVLDMWDVGVSHERDQVEYEICAFSQNREGGEAEALEAGVVH